VGIGFSIFLFVVGAILTFAVDVRTEGFNLDTIGIILMVVGGDQTAAVAAVLEQLLALPAPRRSRTVRRASG
jgi:hypothetical protein